MRFFLKGLSAAVAVTAALASPAHAKFILDVRTAGSSATGTAAIGGGFMVTQAMIQPSGTGVFDPFLRIQQKEFDDQERGYNTNDGTPLDVHPPAGAGNHTHALQLGDIPVVTIGGVQFREFILDVDQVANGAISLNQIQLFQSAAPIGAKNSDFSLIDADGTHDAVISFGSLTPVFQMNLRQNNGTSLATNNEIWADSGHGNGTADMFLYVRDSVFANTPDSYITMFNQFGTAYTFDHRTIVATNGTFAANSSFEEWALRGPTVNAVPAPPSAVLAAIGLAVSGFGYFGRRRRLVGAG